MKSPGCLIYLPLKSGTRFISSKMNLYSKRKIPRLRQAVPAHDLPLFFCLLKKERNTRRFPGTPRTSGATAHDLPTSGFSKKAERRFPPTFFEKTEDSPQFRQAEPRLMTFPNIFFLFFLFYPPFFRLTKERRKHIVSHPSSV